MRGGVGVEIKLRKTRNITQNIMYDQLTKDLFLFDIKIYYYILFHGYITEIMSFVSLLFFSSVLFLLPGAVNANLFIFRQISYQNQIDLILTAELINSNFDS